MFILRGTLSPVLFSYRKPAQHGPKMPCGFVMERQTMSTLATTVDGLKLPNPFIVASGPPGTNLNVIGKAFKEGWGAVIAKTVSLDASKVINVTPRYARLMGHDGQ